MQMKAREFQTPLPLQTRSLAAPMTGQAESQGKTCGGCFECRCWLNDITPVNL